MVRFLVRERLHGRCAAMGVAGAGAQRWCWGQFVGLDPNVAFTERWRETLALSCVLSTIGTLKER